MTTALFGFGVLVQVGAPVQALGAVVRGVVVERVVELNHAGVGLEAQLERGTGVLLAVGFVRVFEHHDLAVGGEGGLEEDVVGASYRIVIVVGSAVAVSGGRHAVGGQSRVDHVCIDVHICEGQSAGQTGSLSVTFLGVG